MQKLTHPGGKTSKANAVNNCSTQEAIINLMNFRLSKHTEKRLSEIFMTY
jgi:hypothetical protein